MWVPKLLGWSIWYSTRQKKVTPKSRALATARKRQLYGSMSRLEALFLASFWCELRLMNSNNLSRRSHVQYIRLHSAATAAVNTHLNSREGRKVRELRDQAMNIMNISSRDKSRAIFTATPAIWICTTAARKQSRAVASGRKLRVTFFLTVFSHGCFVESVLSGNSSRFGKCQD